MKLAVDVHYLGDGALAAAVAFDEWDAPEASRTFTSRVAHMDKPARGKPDLRELPCLVQLLREHALEPDVIVIDGPVRLRRGGNAGAGPNSVRRSRWSHRHHWRLDEIDARHAGAVRGIPGREARPSHRDLRRH